MYQPAGAYSRMGSDAAAHAVRALVPECFPGGWVGDMAAQMAAAEASG